MLEKRNFRIMKIAFIYLQDSNFDFSKRVGKQNLHH